VARGLIILLCGPWCQKGWTALPCALDTSTIEGTNYNCSMLWSGLKGCIVL